MAVAAPGLAEQDKARIRTYCNDTWFDYRFIWLNPKNRAIHLGYWGPDTKTHSESLFEVNRIMADRAEIAR